MRRRRRRPAQRGPGITISPWLLLVLWFGSILLIGLIARW